MNSPAKICFYVSLAFAFVLPQDSLRAQTVPDGFEITYISDIGRDPTSFMLMPDERILVISHQAGSIRAVVNGVASSTPLVTIPNIVKTSEQGLLGIAVDPDFPDSNYIYLFHTQDDSTNRVSRVTVDGDLYDPHSSNLSIDYATRRDLLVLPDSSRFHNGGTLRFGSDKTLYISHGEDNRPRTAQRLDSPNGKILRINRDGTPAADNPTFPDAPAEARADIFAFGLRNPYRFSIDPLTGDLFIGDVGAALYEEFNISSGGENYGWPRFEGPVVNLADAELSEPEPMPGIFHYLQMPNARAAMALLTYRPKDGPEDVSFPEAFDGVHFHADFFKGDLDYLRSDSGGSWESVNFGSGFRGLVDGAIAPDGGIYLLEYGWPLSHDGRLIHIAYTGEPGGELLPPPELIYPDIDETAYTDAQFVWSTAADAEMYQFQVLTDSSETEDVVLDTTVVDTLLNVILLEPEGWYTWRVRALSETQSSPWTAARRFYLMFPVSREGEPELAEAFVITAAYPNPFSESTRIQFEVDAPAEVRFTVFNVHGQRVDLQILGTRRAGSHVIEWAPEGLSAGVYVGVFDVAGQRQRVVLFYSR